MACSPGVMVALELGAETKGFGPRKIDVCFRQKLDRERKPDDAPAPRRQQPRRCGIHHVRSYLEPRYRCVCRARFCASFLVQRELRRPSYPAYSLSTSYFPGDKIAKNSSPIDTGSACRRRCNLLRDPRNEAADGEKSSRQTKRRPVRVDQQDSTAYERLVLLVVGAGISGFYIRRYRRSVCFLSQSSRLRGTDAVPCAFYRGQIPQCLRNVLRVFDRYLHGRGACGVYLRLPPRSLPFGRLEKDRVPTSCKSSLGQ